MSAQPAIVCFPASRSHSLVSARISPACAGGRPCRTQGRGFSFSRPTEPGGGLLRRTLGPGLLLAVSALEAVFCTFSLPRDSPISILIFINSSIQSYHCDSQLFPKSSNGKEQHVQFSATCELGRVLLRRRMTSLVAVAMLQAFHVVVLSMHVRMKSFERRSDTVALRVYLALAVAVVMLVPALLPPCLCGRCPLLFCPPCLRGWC